jgi:excisionase family DNA binding protein
MSLEHDPARQRLQRKPLQLLAYTVAEWCAATKLSRQTVYRMMADGRLRFVQIGTIRRIPASEAVRLGFVSEI